MRSTAETEYHRVQLLQKAALMSNDGTVADNNQKINALIQERADPSAKGKNDVPLLNDILGIVLPQSVVDLAMLGFDAADKIVKAADNEKVASNSMNGKKPNPFDNQAASVRYDSSSGMKAETKKEITAEGVCQEIRLRIKLLYDVIEKMLFDSDFGLMGYYRAFFDDFRREVDDQMMSEGGVIKGMAFRYCTKVWPQEEMFCSDDARQRMQQKLASLQARLSI